MHSITYILLITLFLCGCLRKKVQTTEYIENKKFIISSAEWSQELTKDGQDLGRLIVDIEDEKVNDPAMFNQAVEVLQQKLDNKIEYYSSLSVPTASEGYRKLFVEYLTWQKTAVARMAEEVLPLALDRTTTSDRRHTLVISAIQGIFSVESKWKKRLDQAVDDIQTELKKRS